MSDVNSQPDPRILAVIPARYASQRFPGKPLERICEKPMIQWIYEACAETACFDRVVVATDDQRILEAAKAFGGEAMMTSDRHSTGTDRVAEVAAAIEGFDVVVNVQGDQPFVTPEILTTLVDPYLQGERPDMATLACPLPDDGRENVNTVKVLCDQSMNAMYFSRSPVPFYREVHEAPVYHHLGLYAFTMSFVQQYTKLPATPLERCEQLEQLRAMEHGYRIRVSLIDAAIPEVNTPEDLVIASRLMEQRNKLLVDS